ncbi:MAG: hypothetical protein AAFX93_02120 [Verrucomicrobiota bacterium]
MASDRRTNLGLPIIIGAVVLFVVSALGLVPAFRDKAALLHFPALVIAIFNLGLGLAVLQIGPSQTSSKSDRGDEEG